MRKYIMTFSSLLTMIILWYVLYFTIQNSLLLPHMIDVFKAVLDIFTSALVIDIGYSVLRLLVSFTLSAMLGIMFGFISWKSDGFETYSRPFVLILKTIPVVSVIVILFILIGSDISPYLITFSMIFPLFYQATLDGLKSIDPYLIDVLKLDEVHFTECIRYAYLPSIKSNLLITMFQSFGLGIKVLVMSEYLMQVRHSIGQQLFLAKLNLNYSMVYAWTLILVILALMFESLVILTKKRMAA